MRPGLNEDLESEPNGRLSEEPTEDLDSLETIQRLLKVQNKALLDLTGKLIETTTKLDTLESHQDQSDAAIIEVAKKVGGGGGSGKGDLLTQVLPYLMQPRGPSPLEKVAQSMFIRNLSFSTLVTDRLAKKQFGDEYTKMVKEMEADLSASKKPKGT